MAARASGDAPGPLLRLRLVHAGCLLAALMLTSACIRRPHDPGPRQWQMRGVVVGVHGSALELRHKTGQTVTLLLDQQTTYTHGGDAASVERLLPGTRVMVDIETSAGLPRARHIRIFGRPSTGSAANTRHGYGPSPTGMSKWCTSSRVPRDS